MAECINGDAIIWVEKWRPRSISECILPVALKQSLMDIAKSGTIPNMLFFGGPGVGKTTVARALCNEMDAEYLFINASMDGNIDTLRTTIRQFASALSLEGKRKVVILDEADALSAATQPALRGFIEEFSGNTSFIFTCNFKNKIIAPLHSRCSVIGFDIPKAEKAVLQKALYTRIKEILNQEGITFDKQLLIDVVTKYYPDIRRMLNELQRASASGTIDGTVLQSVTGEQIDKLFRYIKERDFPKMRQWVAENSDLDTSMVLSQIFQELHRFSKPTQPDAVVILADADYKNAFAMHKELNLVAMLILLSNGCEVV